MCSMHDFDVPIVSNNLLIFISEMDEEYDEHLIHFKVQIHQNYTRIVAYF